MIEGDEVEIVEEVIFVGGRLGRRIEIKIMCKEMDKKREFMSIEEIFKKRKKVVEIMKVDREEIIEEKIIEKSKEGEKGEGILLRFERIVMKEFGKILRKMIRRIEKNEIGEKGKEERKIGNNRESRRRNRNIIVVENKDKERIKRKGIVNRLIGNER